MVTQGFSCPINKVDLGQSQKKMIGPVIKPKVRLLVSICSKAFLQMAFLFKRFEEIRRIDLCQIM